MVEGPQGRGIAAMKFSAFILVFSLTPPAQAHWQKVLDKVAVERFVERDGALWALPEMAVSRDWGRTWSVDVSEAESSDIDIGPEGWVASTDKFGLFDVSRGEEEIIRGSYEGTPELWTIRFLGKRLVGVGMMSDSSSDDGSDAVYVSSDFGRSWEKSKVRSFDSQMSIFVLDPKRAWVAVSGNAGTALWRTKDGAKRWESAHVLGGSPEGLFFLDKKRGWLACSAGGQREIFGTNDGGETWTSLARLDASTGPVSGLVFADRDRGWAAAPGGLWRTEDGGRSWVSEAPPDDQPWPYSVGLYYGREGRREYLIYGTDKWADRTDEWLAGEDIDQRFIQTGAIYRRELESP